MNCERTRELSSDYLDGELEPAARAQLDAHLADCDACGEELFELRESLRLLSSLPDPEPPAYLASKVMARIEAGEGRAPLWSRAFRFAVSPSLAAPVAAGFAAVLLVALLDFDPAGLDFDPGVGGLLLDSPDSGPAIVGFSGSSGSGAIANARGPQASRPPVVPRAFATRLPQPRVASSFVEWNPIRRDGAASSEMALGASAGFRGHTLLDPSLGDLDAELQQMLLDPRPFLERIEEIAPGTRDRSLAPLLSRSAERGDALDVAQALRRVRHPLASPVASRFEEVALSR